MENVSSYKILFSKLNEKSNDAIVSVEVKLKNSEIKQEFISLKRIDNEWKVIE
ncbi:DUF4878 domain-containing protein [Aliarcobacter butzleri]|uniref:DUF4878 domain-containing protein n=1 Tax=Aliarcobacter butzleri TaxID=28197 RepID=UPI0024DE1AD2|nr:DUF4878 domain-containing protein [Aliarcobacter butzleri]MDK2080842.1 DUF4878 domain-containing protein [Aliarcobacter butzleri]